MKTLRLIVVSAIFATIFALTTFAQATGKVGIIDPGAFEDEKQGITKLVNAIATVNKEFEPRGLELKTMQEKMAAIQKEGQAMVKAYETNDKGPIGPQQIQAKTDELEKMQVEFKRKQEDASNAYQRRLGTVTGPIYADIRKAIGDFATQKGFAVLLDASNIGQTQENPGVSIYIYVDKNANVSNDFIAFCNTKFAAPATAAKPTTPK
jgi:Skp family chaperone for outer membrane proteins